MRRLRKTTSNVFTLLMALSVFGCSELSDGPQKKHTFTGGLTDEQRALAGNNKAVRERIIKEERTDQHKRLLVKVAKLDSDSPISGLGMLPNNLSFVVQRDSNAALLSKGGALTKLDKLVNRVDYAHAAGPNSNRILGLSAHGTQAVWNANNLSQQLVLRPQKSTFDRVKTFDAKAISKGRYLVTASEGGLIERWSLTSGNRVQFVRFKKYQPRQIALNSSVNHVIFGTNDGQVRIWHGGNGSKFQYRHSGPLLKLWYLPKRKWIVSVGKDGQLILFSRKTHKIVFSHQFSKANYEVVISKDEKRLIAAPAVGAPISIDLTDLKLSKIRQTPTRLTSTVHFGQSSDVAISRHGGKGLMMWNFSQKSPITYKVTSATQGRPIDYSIARTSNVAAILTDKDRIEYWDIKTRKYLGPAFKSLNSSIAKFEISANGSWLVVGLTDGRIVRLRVSFDEKMPVELFAK